jgi:hypothetical protein
MKIIKLNVNFMRRKMMIEKLTLWAMLGNNAMLKQQMDAYNAIQTIIEAKQPTKVEIKEAEKLSERTTMSYNDSLNYIISKRNNND